MAKFVKIKLNANNEKGLVWRLVLETTEDVWAYNKLDAHLNIQGYLTLDLNAHPTGRGANMLALINTKAMSLKEGEILNPIVEIDNIVNEKVRKMAEYVQKGRVITVNHAGGYCFLDGFLESYNATIVETIIKPDFGFPVDDEIIKTDFLILENDEKGGVRGYLRDYIDKNKITDYKVINSLREVDLGYVIKGIQNAKTIGVHSAFLDGEQINNFLELFASDAIEPKNILISAYNITDTSGLTEHSLFEACSNKHNITFLNPNT